MINNQFDGFFLVLLCGIIVLSKFVKKTLVSTEGAGYGRPPPLNNPRPDGKNRFYGAILLSFGTPKTFLSFHLRNVFTSK